MEIGTSGDMQRRLRSLIPQGWFGDDAPIRDVVLGGLGDALAWSYGLLGFAEAQTRIGTASGWFLDLIGWDFLGVRILRRDGEKDDAWRARLRAEIFRPRVTRWAISKALEDLTGIKPKLVEPWNPNDCGTYGRGGAAYAGRDYAPQRVGGYNRRGAYNTGLSGYGVIQGPSGNSSPGMGCWGSRKVNFQLFVTAYRSATGSLTPSAGYGRGGGYGTGRMRYVSRGELEPTITDDEILNTVADTAPAGVIAWTAIRSAPALA